MKKNFYLIASTLILAGFMNSCQLFDDLVDISFDTEYTNIDFTVYPAEAGDHVFTDVLTQSDIEAEIEEHGGDAVNLDEITVSEAILIIQTAGVTFDPFERIEVYVGTADVPERMIGSAALSANGLVEVTLEVSNEDIADIIEADEYNVRVIGTLGEELTFEVDMRLRVKYHVVV